MCSFVHTGYENRRFIHVRGIERTEIIAGIPKFDLENLAEIVNFLSARKNKIIT